MKKILLTVFSVLLLCLSVTAQNQRVTGIVTDGDGTPVVGAIVALQGTQTAVVTGSDGQYSINAPADGILEFTYLGMEDQVMPISGRSSIDVAMVSESKRIDDVIVVAYGTAKKEAFTGSAAVVGETELSKRQITNVTQAIAGQVAGVQVINTTGQPGTTASIRIRGVGSMSASNTPLYVVDGSPYDGDISAINPADIESMSILKDAAASAIYGNRGSNGVVLITTKRGKIGGAVVTVDMKWGSSSRAIPQYNVMTDPGMYYETLYQAMYNGYLNAAGATPYSAHIKANQNIFEGVGTGYRVYDYPAGEYFIGTNGKINPSATLGWSDGEYYYAPDDWYSELFDKGNFRQEYNIGVSGATDKSNFYLSTGYVNDPGIIPNSGFERYSARLKADYQAKKWLKVGANIGFTHFNSASPDGQTISSDSGNIFYVSNMIAPIYPLYVRNADGSIKIDDNGYTVYDFGDRTSTNQDRTFMNGSNPASVLALNKREYVGDVVSLRTFANIDIYKGLKFSVNLGADVNNTMLTSRYNKYYGQYAVADGGNVSKVQERMFAVNQNYLLTYAKDFGFHNIDVLVGFESMNKKMSDLAGYRTKIYMDNTDELDGAILNQRAYSSSDRYANMGFIGRVQYDYKDRYFVSGSFRRDASSRFHPDNRWGNFGSIGAAWLINNEDFFKVSWVDLLKVKVSYGVQGNDGILYDGTIYHNYYPYVDQYKISESDGDFAVSLDYKGNKDISWETSHNMNLAIEFGLFNNRLNGSVEYYRRKTTDLLFNQPVAPSLGVNTIPTNVGAILNTGVEIDLSYLIIHNKNVSWAVNANLTTQKNTILSLHESVGSTGIKDGTKIYRVGGSLYNMYIRDWAGVDKTTGESLYYVVKELEYQYEADGVTRKVTTDTGKTEAIDTGSLLAKVYGGFGTSVTFYGFDFSINASYQLGGKVYDNTYAALMHGGGGTAGQNWHLDVLNAWTPQNADSNTPRLNTLDKGTNSVSTRFLISSDYLSINNITFGYTVPLRITEKAKISSLRIYFSADNVGLFAKRKGLDPRQSMGGAVGSYRYSPIRTVSGGISLAF